MPSKKTRKQTRARQSISTGEPRGKKTRRGSKTRALGDPKSTSEDPLWVDSEEDLQERLDALNALREAADLPMAYAALERVRASLHEGATLSAEDEELINDASLAVPYLIYKQLVELFTRPRSFRGLAFSVAKAQMLAKKILETLGPESCVLDMTEEILMAKCEIEQVDAHKVLPKLQQVGIEIRTKASG